MRFTALLHHITPQLLVESFHALRKDAAAGVDGVTWREYEEGRYERVHGLHREIHTGVYRAKPSRRVFIPKLDPPLGERFSQAVVQLNQAVAGNGDLREKALALKALAIDAAHQIAANGINRENLRSMALALVDDGLAGAYPDYAGAEQAAMALGSVVNTLHKLGQLKSAADLNRGLEQIRGVLRYDEAYKPAEFQDRLRGFRPLVAAPLATR